MRDLKKIKIICDTFSIPYWKWGCAVCPLGFEGENGFRCSLELLGYPSNDNNKNIGTCVMVLDDMMWRKGNK